MCGDAGSAFVTTETGLGIPRGLSLWTRAALAKPNMIPTKRIGLCMLRGTNSQKYSLY